MFRGSFKKGTTLIMASSNYKGRPEGNNRLPQNNGNGNGYHEDDRQEQERGTRDKPAAEFSMGRIRAVVWKNASKQGDWYSVAITRSYKDDAGNWKQASTFGYDDLLAVAEASRAAWAFIVKERGGKIE